MPARRSVANSDSRNCTGMLRRLAISPIGTGAEPPVRASSTRALTAYGDFEVIASIAARASLGYAHDSGRRGMGNTMLALGRPPIESPEPVLKFAALRLFLTVAALVALVATGTPFHGHLTIVVAAVGLPWALGNLMLAQRRPDLELNPMVAARDIALLIVVELVTPETYGAVRFLAIFFIAAPAQFQGQGRGLGVALAGASVLVPIAALRGAPIHRNMLAFYESVVLVTP